MELNLGAITGLCLACTELSKQTQLETLNPHAHFPSPSVAHTLLTGCQCALLHWELLLKDKETPTTSGKESANTGSLHCVYGLDNNEFWPAYECVFLVMQQLVHGNRKDSFCMW